MSEKINWTPELLAECRNERGVVFGMMSADARLAIQSKRTEHNTVETWSAASNGWSNFGFGTCEMQRAYRISPSYVPPELEMKKWVDVPVITHADTMTLAFVHPNWQDGLGIVNSGRLWTSASDKLKNEENNNAEG